MNNRELKFRVWLHDTKEWGNVSCIEVFNSTGKLEYLYQDQPYTIQQYTGLKDSKGNEIYEGDIVKYNPDDRTIEREGIIEWSNYYHGWTIRDKQCYPESNYGVFSLASPFMSFNDVEIICHIFENPELLKTNE
jgi:uncharacterized phage protein (TIGR01671 family)